MTYEAKDFTHLLGTAGFSDKLLETHLKLYGGYVANTNKLMDTLKQLIQDGKTATPEFAELKRRFGWEFNGMRLHELYFGNMSKKKKTLADHSPLAKAMAESLGSVQARLDVFIQGLAMEALIGLGDMPHPATRKQAVNLPHAKYLIDLLGILEEKTKGNLSVDEERLFKDLLYQMRMRYLTKSGGVAPV